MIPTVLTNINIVDATRTEPFTNAAIVIREGSIHDIISRDSVPNMRDAKIVDLDGAWVIPGLIATHNHMVSPLAPFYFPKEPIIDRYIRQGRETMDALKVGFTSLRVVGAPDFSDVAWKQAFESGLYTGPRLFVAGHALAPTAGHGQGMRCSVEADGSEGFRRLVREQIQGGADFIKVVMTGGVMGACWDDPDHAHLMDDELAAIFDVAKARGYQVAAHAASPETVKTAVRGGAYTIEHGYTLDEEAVRLMADHGTYYNPTFCITHLIPQAAESEYHKAYVEEWPLQDDLHQRANERRPEHVEGFKMALEYGVRIASGCDAGPLKDTGLLEIELLVQNGMTPIEAIKAATLHGAAVCDMQDKIGSIEVGKLADLLVLKKNPLENIHNIRTVRMVLKGGVVVHNSTS